MITPSFSLTATERVLPKLALDFTTASLDSRVTFARTGNTATVVNSSGYVTPINANLPRFDYNPITLVCKGLLIEEQRENLLLYSADFNDVIWSKSAASISPTKVTSPENTLTGQKLVESATTAAHYAQQIVAVASGAAYTFSVYAKAGERTSFAMLTAQSTSPFTTHSLVDFNLANGTIVSTSSGSGTITAAGNGWYRCSVTGTTSSGGELVRITFATVGNGTFGIFIWGAQLESGAFATSYIPTVASAVTRNPDVATMTGTNFSDWYNAGAGGVVSRVLPSTVSGTRPALQFDDATADEVIVLRGNTTNPELVIVDGGSPQAQIDAGTIAANTAYNLGAAWNTDNCAAAVNGGAAVTDTTATIPTVTQARLGSDGTNYLNGNIQTLRYWPQRIINAEVQAFSK